MLLKVCLHFEKPTVFIAKTMIIRRNIFACLLSVHNTISLRHEQVCLTSMFNYA